MYIPKKKDSFIKIVIKAIFVCTFIIFIFYIWNHNSDAIESQSQNKVVHISIDDVEAIFDLINNQDTYSSLFDQPFMGYLKELHDRYGAYFALYTYRSTKCGGG